MNADSQLTGKAFAHYANPCSKLSTLSWSRPTNAPKPRKETEMLAIIGFILGMGIGVPFAVRYGEDLCERLDRIAALARFELWLRKTFERTK